MKGKKQKGKAQRTISEAIPEVPNDFKSSEPTYQILGNTGGDYIKTQLPSNFFESVMFGEMSLEYDFSIEGLTKLMDLYSLGIQYFLENNPVQAKYFQDRMGYILTNKDTLSNLKKQQDKEEKEKKEKDIDKNKMNEKKDKDKKEEKKEYPKSCKNLPKVTRQRAKTNFMFKAQTIKKEDIKRKVTFVLHDTTKIKEDKENVKSIIKEDLNQQNLQWKEKLKKKRENFNANFGFTRPRNRTTFIAKKKTFQTPGPSISRSIMTLNSPSTKSPNQDNFGFGLKEKPNKQESKTSEKKYMNIDQENSEIDDMEKNEGDIEFLKKLKERHKNDEDDKDDKDDKEEEKKENKKEDNDDSDSGSSSDSDSEGGGEEKKRKNSDEFLNKIDEVEEEKEPLSLRQSARKGELNKKKDLENNDDNKNIDNKDDNKNIDNKDDNKNEENKDDNNKANNANNQEVKEKENNENSFSTQTTEIKNDVPPAKKRTSIVDEKNLVRDIELDDVIVEAVEKKMKRIENLNKINDPNNNNDKGDEEASEGQTDEISSISNTLANPIQDLRLTIEDIPLKFQETYTEVEIEMNRYVKDLNNHFYNDTFEMFSLELKELYDKKYKKYVEVNNEYHASITENEYQLDNDNNLTEEQKLEIQNIIDCLKEEQKDQIDKITDEYNQMIDSKIRDFKQTFFKKDCGINLMEEQLKLDIYTMINEAYY